MYKFTVFIFSLLINLAVFAKDQAILIFLDDSESSVEAITGDLIVALSQKPGPILLSTSLLRNIFSNGKSELQNKSDEDLVAQYKQATSHSKDQSPEQKAADIKFILRKAMNFNNKEWIIKRVGESMYLLIPNNYIKQNTNLSVEEVRAYDPQSPKISDTELTLGLKVNHLETVDTIAQINSIPAVKENNADYFIKALNDNSIFCTKIDYSHDETAMPSWALFVTGHGEYQRSIVGVSIDKFGQILNFLTQKIHCVLFIYSSCYAAGSNAVTAYNENKSLITKSLPFAIITQAITDAPTLATLPKVELKDGALKISSGHLNFAEFFKLVSRTDEPHDYLRLMKTLSSARELSGVDLANIPQIRVPGTEWFSVLASPKEIVGIGSILSKARDAHRPLNLVSYFKTDPKAVLLYAANLPFELILDSKNIESIISMIPGDATHVIDKISAPNKSITDIINLFMTIEGIAAEKIFYIKDINGIKDVIISSSKPQGGKFQASVETQNLACYSFGGKTYLQEHPNHAQTTDENNPKYKKCLSILHKMQGKVAEMGEIDLSNKEMIRYPSFFPRINNNLIIQKVKASHLPFKVIYYALEEKIEKGYVVIIKQLDVQYGEEYLSIPGLQIGQVVTLHNVVFDNRDRLHYYYTYENNYYLGKNKIDTDYMNITLKIMSEVPQQKDSSQLPSSISPEMYDHLKKTLGEKLALQRLKYAASKLPGYKLTEAVDKLSKEQWELGRQFVFDSGSTEKKGDIQYIQDFIKKLKRNNIINAILPLRYTTPLFLAIQQKMDYEIIESLLNSGAELNRDATFSAIYFALDAGLPLKTMQLLLDRGALIKDHRLILTFALRNISPDRNKILELLLKRGLDPNPLTSPKGYSTPIMDIVLRGRDYDIAQTLVKNGWDVNSESKLAKSILGYLLSKSNAPDNEQEASSITSLIKMLIEKGAKISQKNIDMTTNPELKKYLNEHKKRTKLS